MKCPVSCLCGTQGTFPDLLQSTFGYFPETVIGFLFLTNFCYVKFPVNIDLLTNHLEKAKDLFCRKGNLKNSFIELFSQS